MLSLRSRSVWHLVDSVATAMSQSYGIARARALNNPLELVRMTAQRDHLYTESALLERELEIFRSSRLAKPPRERPHFTPEQRAQIMQLAERRLNEYQTWYNEHRVHGAHYAHTPEDAIRGVDPIPILYTVKGGIEPEIRVARQSARGDAKLFRLEIRVRERKRAA